MTYDWKKSDKHLYLTKASPVSVAIPKMGFFSIKGQGDPNAKNFGQVIEALYTASYTLKMLPKKQPSPAGYFEYAVFPLEAVWELPKSANLHDKSQYIFDVQIRQPDFLTPQLALQVVEMAKKKKPALPWPDMGYVQVEEGLCVQMLHLGAYDDEQRTFAVMDGFCTQNKYHRVSKAHREIYLNDPRKISPDKLKTLLRYQIAKV